MKEFFDNIPKSVLISFFVALLVVVLVWLGRSLIDKNKPTKEQDKDEVYYDYVIETNKLAKLEVTYYNYLDEKGVLTQDSLSIGNPMIVDENTSREQKKELFKKIIITDIAVSIITTNKVKKIIKK